MAKIEGDSEMAEEGERHGLQAGDMVGCHLEQCREGQGSKLGSRRMRRDEASQATELRAYLDASQWHSDVYPWRIQLAKARLAKLQGHRRPVSNVPAGAIK